MRVRYIQFGVYFVAIIGILGLGLILRNWFRPGERVVKYRKVAWNEEIVVPNIVHYVLYEKNHLDFILFLSIISAIKVQRPERLLIHCDFEELTGHYWSVLKSLPFSNVSIELWYRQRPTHVHGQLLSSVYHAADVTRIQILMEWGGIYLDGDMVLLHSLDKFRHFEMVIGWPEGQYIGTQILIAHKDAQFLQLWLDGYERYLPRDWYYNAGQYPTEQLLMKYPVLAHHEPVIFGVHNLADKLYGKSRWAGWRTLTAIHLLSRHFPAPQHFNESFIQNYTAPFGDIARWILYKLQPKVTAVLL